MKILVVGSGGREHALVWKMGQSPLVKKIFAAPGNAGIQDLAECVPIQADQIEELLAFAKKESIDLTVVGPELPLVNGIVDRFESEGLAIFGPSKAAARLEGSKSFSKNLMAKAGVPTAPFGVFTTVNEAKHFIVEKEPPFVIKADGLAAGKGVIIAESCEEGVKVVNEMIDRGLFGDSGKTVVIEEHLKGDELSILLFTDGKQILPLASSQDHKRAYDYDRGPNTGGMGAYSPCPSVTDEDLNKIIKQTAEPVINELYRQGTPYKGILYVGIMLVNGKAQVLEYNVRFGDPEAQAVIPRLKTDIVPVMLQIAKGSLETKKLEWDERTCIAVVMASKGYPGKYEKGIKIEGLDVIKDKKDVVVFHAGTAQESDGTIVTNGGRVLALSALGATLHEVQGTAYEAIQKIVFTGSFYRRDIGKKVFEKTEIGK
jgi:phosphoribosylamine---glycine ligase